jgi:hypothetical protein
MYLYRKDPSDSSYEGTISQQFASFICLEWGEEGIRSTMPDKRKVESSA